MNIIHCNPKTAGRLKGSSFSSASGFPRRTFPALMALVVCFVLATGLGIGVDEAYADTLDVWVSTSSDDAEEAASGSMDMTSSDLELVNNQQVGMRFQGITIEQGATITSAYI
jgi:hypothetical protein